MVTKFWQRQCVKLANGQAEALRLFKGLQVMVVRVCIRAPENHKILLDHKSSCHATFSVAAPFHMRTKAAPILYEL